MADYDRRNGYRGGNNSRKRQRYREDDDFDRRPQRRRYEEPAHIKLRKQLLGLAESPVKKTEDEISNIAKAVAEGYEDEEMRNTFLDLSSQLIVEQPFKIPFVAAIVLAANPQKPEVAQEMLSRAGKAFQEYLQAGAWREIKLILRFLACLQGLLEGEGVFSILEDLFSTAVDLQTASSEDGLGLELVKIILLTITYLMASSATGLEEQALSLLEKTDIIASTPHALEALVDPYPGNEEVNSHEPQSVIALLQRQLQTEAGQSWKLACVPRPWKVLTELRPLEEGQKHSVPEVIIPSPVSSGAQPCLPEIYFSVYADQDLETVPPVSDIASSVLRDSLVDTINILDYNRNATAKFLVELDCYFAADTFVKRATPFDKLRDVGEERSTWKPEDVAVDAVFSQLFQLPQSEHKLVYYHSVLTEACKIAPAAIAPSLGRAIRYLYKGVDSMDLELEYRFMDWFSHHLSNFGFTWKWTEWVDDVELSLVHPKKAFMVGALEKEIRLSFAQRIRGTLPEPYQSLISEAKEKDTPDFKYSSDRLSTQASIVLPTTNLRIVTPYATQAREILRLLRAKSPDSEIAVPIDVIQDLAIDQGLPDILVPSTDAYVTSICFLGSKSLSHVLSCIERCRERLLAIGSSSEPARRQIVTSVMAYWAEKPGVGVNIVDKLLNYTILTPISVIEWVLIDQLSRGKILTHAHIYEMVASTVHKVTNRVRQIAIARNQRRLPADQKELLDETLEKERAEMKRLFTLVEDALRGVAEGSADAMAESADQDEEGEALLRGWGRRWLRVFRRKMAVEEAWVLEMLEVGDRMETREEVGLNGNGAGDGNGNAVAVGSEGPDMMDDEIP
ncbi:hypothetical protein MMC18_008130 [Xylographa bjoerkii]|nr:hypothetical protein [Xylographa bjoerkii]